MQTLLEENQVLNMQQLFFGSPEVSDKCTSLKDAIAMC